jgi:anthranilate phosphoribosyltransferase
MQLLGGERSVVVCGEDGMDEVTLFGCTRAIETRTGQSREFSWTPEDFGLKTARGGRESLTAATPAESAALIRRVLNGEPGPPREIVILNAAAALWTVGLDETLSACAKRAQEALDTGAARDKLARWIEVSN